jgi:hypothetical protein
MIWLEDGGELIWRSILDQPDSVPDVVTEHAEHLVNEHTRQQLFDLEMPSLPGARLRLMGLKQALQDLLPSHAGTWTLTQWKRIDPDDWPQANGLYMVLQGTPCPSKSPFQSLELELPA